MLEFMRHEYDVFVCTTIVENGLDIPLANTIIIENAERYGLSELYQLRGRVGRSNRRAYAYLLVPPDTELSEVARKRLAALKEFSDLGAGFKIAALDLELRGAGNLLGGEQHGHINAVGFDMYVRLLEETVRELKGEEVPAGDSLQPEPGPGYSHSGRIHCGREPAPARLSPDRQCGHARRPRAGGEGTGRPLRSGARSGAQSAGVLGIEDCRREAGHRSHRPAAHAAQREVPPGDAHRSGAADEPGESHARARNSRPRAC